MARPRKLLETSKKNYTKEEINQRKKEEQELEQFEPITLSPPSWLSEEAQVEYDRIVPLMKKLPIAALDLASVELYCDYYSKYKGASTSVEEQGRTIIELDAQGNDKKKVNPEFIAMNDSARMIVSLSNKLGLTIDSRMRIVVPKVEKPHDPFEEMLNDD